MTAQHKANPQDVAATSSSAVTSDLYDRLDSLWITYLAHVDQYTKSQKLLQKHMKDGFFSLARANFNARNGIRNYGKDFYHDRAIAARRACITMDEESKAKVQIMNIIDKSTQEDGDDTPEKPEDPTKESPEPQQQPSPPATPAPEDADDDSKTEDDPAGAETDLHDEVKEKPAPAKVPLESDPLRWFGVLIPRELRSVQASFSSAIDEAVAQAADAAKGLRETEVEIRRLRKEVRKAEKAEERRMKKET